MGFGILGIWRLEMEFVGFLVYGQEYGRSEGLYISRSAV